MDSIFTALLIGAAVILVAALIVFALLKLRARTTNANAKRFLDGMLIYAYEAIQVGEIIARDSLDQLGAILKAADRKAIADSWYNTLPDSIPIAGRSIPILEIKKVVTREMFQDMVKTLYDQVNAKAINAKPYLRKQIDAVIPDEYERNKALFG